jgi:hypothetical protein
MFDELLQQLELVESQMNWASPQRHNVDCYRARRARPSALRISTLLPSSWIQRGGRKW